MPDIEAIYREHFQGVYRYVFSLCRDETLAEEVTQETFFRALQGLDRFRGDCRMFVWLCQIAKNTWSSFCRKQKRLTHDPEALDRPGPDMESGIIDRDEALRLHRLLHELPEPYKEVFTLRVFGELAFSQIGALFGKTDSWARLVFYRAKTMLRKDVTE